MVINIQDDILKIQASGLLGKMLADKTTKKNIMWATDAYDSLGDRYCKKEEITVDLITGFNIEVIDTRARKAEKQQSERTKRHAEVFANTDIKGGAADKAQSQNMRLCTGSQRDNTISVKAVHPKNSASMSSRGMPLKLFLSGVFAL